MDNQIIKKLCNDRNKILHAQSLANSYKRRSDNAKNPQSCILEYFIHSFPSLFCLTYSNISTKKRYVRVNGNKI